MKLIKFGLIMYGILLFGKANASDEIIKEVIWEDLCLEYNGKYQLPQAWIEDEEGNKISDLVVSVAQRPDGPSLVEGHAVNAGIYSVTADFDVGDENANKYTLSDYEKAFEINQATATVFWEPDDETYTYDGTDKTPRAYILDIKDIDGEAEIHLTVKIEKIEDEIGEEVEEAVNEGTYLATACFDDQEQEAANYALDPNTTNKSFTIENPTYILTIDSTIMHGRIEADKETEIVAGDIITLSITPDPGHELEYISANTTVDQTNVLLDSLDINIRTFEMPADDVIVTAGFKKTQETLDLIAVQSAKKLVEDEDYTVAQDTANAIVSITEWLVVKINNLIESTGIEIEDSNIEIDEETFNEALNGENGVFDFVVELIKNEASETGIAKGIILAYPVYSVTIDEEIENGTVSADKTENIKEGEIVSLTITPDSGYELEDISAYTTVLDSFDINIRTFEMPANDVTVTARFKKTQEKLNKESTTGAKEAIEGELYNVEQSIANTEEEVKIWLVDIINALIMDFYITVTESDITIGEENFKAAIDGYNGSFDFTVSLSKGTATDTAICSGIITATPDCHPKTCIIRKGTSNILICGDASPGVQYVWGFKERATNTEETLKVDFANYQYIQFPHIDTEKYSYFVQIKYSDGCSTRTYYDPQNECEESLKSSPISKINVFPNPAKHHLSITLEKDIEGYYKVILRNIIGQTVFSKQYENYRNNEVLSIDLDFPAGLYVLTIETKDEVLTYKIVIE